MEMDITFVFIAQRDESIMVKKKLLQDRNNCITLVTPLES